MFYLSNKKLRYIIITLLLLIFCFFLGMFKPKAEEFGWTWGGIQANGYDYNPLTWETRYEILNNSYNYRYWIFNSSTYGSFQIYNNGDITIPESVKYGYVKGIAIYGSSTMLGPQAIRLNNGNERTTICSFTNIDSSFLTLYNDGTISNSHGEKYYQFSCYVRPGQVFNNIEIVSSANKSENATIQAGMHLRLSIDYFYSDNSSSVNSIKDNTNDIKNSINDSSIDSNNASSSASSWNNKNATNGTITQLLTLPISLLQAIVNGLQTSCSSFSLGSLFGTNIILPCIDIGLLIGSGLFTTIDILFSGFMILAIAKKLIKIFNDFTNLKSNQIDELYGGGSK